MTIVGTLLDLRRFIAEARRRARGRRLLATLADLVLLATSVGLVAAVMTGWTRRGDVMAPLAGLVTLAGVGLWSGWQVARARRAWGTDLDAARTIAATARPLSDAPSARQREGELLLRHELLGALELATAERHASRSPALVDAYVRDVARRLAEPRVRPGLALPRPRPRPRVTLASILALAIALAAASPWGLSGWVLLLSARDARPTPPPEPVWSSLQVELHDPPHAARPPRIVPNPTGALRVLAGTRIELDLRARRPAEAGRVVVNYDAAELKHAGPPRVVELERHDEGSRWTGSFVAQAAGTWTIALLDDADDDESEARRSAPMTLQLEPDRAPEVELQPLPRAQREVNERQEVDLRFHARDDFGLARGELVYQLPDGTMHRLPMEPPAGRARTWRHRFTWDISAIPIAERSEVLYWVEVRDDDPGLGLEPLVDPPGKMTRSATMRLTVRDEESEHAANIAKLAEIRDVAVDLLASRMTSDAFEDEPAEPIPGSFVPPVVLRAEQARTLLSHASTLLAMLAATIDAVTMDSLSGEGDAAVLTKIHARLMALHRRELELHERVPPGSERTSPEDVTAALRGMAPHNAKEIVQLEDEIIRLDDLVENQVAKRIEALVARLEATQQKLVEELENLKAGDATARARIEQLQMRRRDDMRRLAEARAMLKREVEEEFMNVDAFAVLEQMQREENLDAMLAEGKVDEALEKMRGQLGDLQQLRDQVQQRLGQPSPATEALSEEERRRMQLLRELSRLQDEQGVVRRQTETLHEAYRDAVGGQASTEPQREAAAERAAALRSALEEINDARLGRAGRRGLEDAIRALQELEALGGAPEAAALPLAEAATRAAEALERAVEGSQAGEAEGRAVRKATREAQRLEGELRRPLPPADEVLSPDALRELADLEARQQALRSRGDAVTTGELAEALPAPGRQAMRQASRSMGESREALEAKQPRGALRSENAAWDALQQAIDSLRRGSPPPPSASAASEASTEAERDRSLRDALLEAMREGSPGEYAEPVQRYYEELLR